ncbi:molybdate ABC transporter substrate-binding protein [Candidatus Gracilibacteria bacterium]|nr:molybdate ABC transporter substrate-binding protein [Candidatus Gracilibacteria bacterium]
MRRTQVGLLAAILVVALNACTVGPAAPGASLTIFAAASLSDAFEEIAVAFAAANDGVTINYNFGGSQQLAAQLNEGAPADVFASANSSQMRVVLEGGRVISGTEHAFAYNRLVVVVPHDNPAKISTLHDLARPGVRLLLADRAVPVGQYSLDFLAKASVRPSFGTTYSASVLRNVVSYEDNVRAVLTKVALGEGDAGIVYTTDAALEAERIARIDIPDELNTVASYPIAPIADSANPELAQAFIDFVLAPAGQAILVKYGFIDVREAREAGFSGGGFVRMASGCGATPRLHLASGVGRADTSAVLTKNPPRERGGRGRGQEAGGAQNTRLRVLRG